MNINKKWLVDLDINLENFLDALKKDKFEFYPVLKGYTKYGQEIQLGHSCYALKIYYIIGKWDKLENSTKEDWVAFINSFQMSREDFPKNSYIDQKYLKAYEKFDLKKFVKNKVKKILNTLFDKKYILNNEKIKDFIKADTKQAISTLYQVGFKQENKYLTEAMENKNILYYLESLDWSKPWNAGAQFASLCVFVETQLNDLDNKNEYLNELKKFLKNISDDKTGAFFAGEKPNKQELINGAMKVITGADWIGLGIPYPEKLIDTCLAIEPESEGCDLVDIVYVLFKCNQITSYRNREIASYFEKLLTEIEKHYFKKFGGFSYYQQKSQKYYYGVKVSKGLNEPDLHGTLLLVWALGMISHVIDLPFGKWKTLKP